MICPLRIFPAAVLTGIRCTQMLALAVLAVVFSSPVSADSPPPGIDAALGNTVDLVLYISFDDREIELPRRFYFTKDGAYVLSPAPPASLEQKDAGETYGHNEKICAEHKRRGHNIGLMLCGLFHVSRNIVTLNFDTESWDTDRSLTSSTKSELVISVDGQGKCRLVSYEQFATSGGRTNRLYSTTGTCRLMRGRHMTLDEE